MIHLEDFNCPQYVDFRAGLDSHSEDIFFDISDNHSPVDGRTCEKLKAPVQGLTEDDENKLVNKMTSALSLLENTPKLKANVPRGKLFSEKTPAKKLIASAPAIHRMLSKSVCTLNKVQKPIKAREFKPKRSSSLNDLRAVKKHTYPKTPLCLKRTMNAKHKNLKTTEEMELEQIAALQKKLTELLRNNEISYKKMKQRQKPCVQKNVVESSRPEIPKGIAGTSVNTNNIRQNFHAMSRAAMRKTAMKIDSIINKESTNKVPRLNCTGILEKSKEPSVSSTTTSEDCNKSRNLMPKKHVNYKLHSGLMFIESKETTPVKPFKWESRIKTETTGTNKKSEVSLARSASHDNDKENICISKPNSAMNMFSNVQKIRADVKLFRSNKKIYGHGQSSENHVRGLSFAENTVRH